MIKFADFIFILGLMLINYGIYRIGLTLGIISTGITLILVALIIMFGTMKERLVTNNKTDT